MTGIQSIGIIGLGLIGGSLAKALKRLNSSVYIAALDKDLDSLAKALNEGIIDRACNSLDDVVKKSNLLFLCTPVDSTIGILEDIRNILPSEIIITDVGSTKSGIMESTRGILPSDVYFIGGHPMAGSENSGYNYSTAHLFENAFYVLTPSEGMPIEPVQSLIGIVSSIGAFPLIMDSYIHDEVVGAISHLPHVVAAALVNTVANIEDPNRFKEKLAAGGFKDITRIASSNPKMWSNISLSNRDKLLELTHSMIAELQNFYDNLKNQKCEYIETFYNNAKRYRDDLPLLQSSALLSYYDIYVDIEDRPGIIGKVASLLGDHNINIRNTRIIHSREHEPGCLVLSLASNKEAEQALFILVREGYRAYRR